MNRKILFFVVIYFIIGAITSQGQDDKRKSSFNANNSGIIAFTSDRDEQNEIYFMNTDGSNQKRITHTAIEEYGPTWSPNGTKLSFRAGGGIYYVDVIDPISGEVSDPHLIIAMGGAKHGWTPDGRIIFDSPYNGSWDIYIVDIDGTNLINVTNDTQTEFDPDVSPDGSQIVYVANFDLWLMDIDGTNRIQITNDQFDFAPAWSPDGNKIALNSTRSGQTDIDICIINTDGSNRIWVTNSPWLDEFASWSPDGTMIAYESDQNNVEVICTINIDGTNYSQLTNSGYNDGGPSWSPFTTPTGINENSYILEFQLYQNFPNPCNQTTTIPFHLHKDGRISLKLYNNSGDEISTIIDETKSRGEYEVLLNIMSFSEGIYYYLLRDGDFVQMKKMIKIK